MSTIIQITSNNFNGQYADITFYPCSGGSINLGYQLLPYDYAQDNYEGTYDIYLSAYTQTCQLVISCPSPTPTTTATPTPTPGVTPPPQNGMLLGIDASDSNCYPGSGTTVYNLAPSQTTGTTFNDVSWNTNYFGFIDSADSKIQFNTNSYNISGTAWTYIMYFTPLSSNSAYLAEKSLAYDSLSLVYGYDGETCRPWMNTYRGMNPVSAPVNELTFVAFTKDDNGITNNYKSYRNGVLQQEFSQDFSLGAQSGFIFNNFDRGQWRLHNFYFYERALSQQEITNVYSYVTS